MPGDSQSTVEPLLHPLLPLACEIGLVTAIPKLLVMKCRLQKGTVTIFDHLAGGVGQDS